MILTTARLPMATLPTIARLAIWLHDYQVERLQLMMRKSDPALLQEQHQSHLYLPTHPSPTHPLTHSPAHPLTRSPTHPLTHSPTHSPSHPLTTTAPTFLQELHQSYLEAAHAFSEQGGQQKKRGKRGVPRDSASRESRESVGSNRRRSSGSSSEQGGEVLLAATAPPATRAPTPDVDGLGKTEFVVSMLVSLGCVEWAAMQNRQPSRGFGHNSPSITPRQRQVMLRVTSLARASLTANWQIGSG